MDGLLELRQRNPHTGQREPDTRSLEIRQVVAGVQTVLASTGLSIPIDTTYYVLRLMVLASGQTTFTLFNTATTATYATLTASSSALATGGTLATGKPGIFDRNTGTETFVRTVDDFRVTANLALDAVLYPNQSAELRTTGMVREDTGGTSYARVESVVGCLPRLPPSGLENRKVELYLKTSRGDFDLIPDTGIDDISAQVFYRPSWLLTPGS